MPFASLGLDRRLLDAVRSLGYEKPTPIQSDAIPPGLAGRDVLACAATGSGKTAAFLLPVLQRLLDRPGGGVRALVLTPTRELAAQIDEHRRLLGAGTKLTGAAVFGGVGMTPQETALRRGVDVLIATPGRLLDHLQHSYARLDGVEILVIDEADRMLDMGFLPDVRRILARLPRDKQVLLFSATMPPEIQQLAGSLQANAARIALERRGTPPRTVTQTVWPVAQELKTHLLLALLESGELENALVFTRTKHRANRVADWLAKRGVQAARIHGNRSQAQRTEALDGFKKGRYRVLVATDVAARGIDIEALPHVVNFDVPAQPDDYVHRVGRTARAEREGDAWTFCAPEEEGDLRAIERVVGRAIPRRQLEGFDYQKRAAEKLEIPVAERIAAIRARKADERQRAREKAARRTAPAVRSERGRAPVAPTSPPARTGARRPTRSPERPAHLQHTLHESRPAHRPASATTPAAVPWWQRRDA